MDNIAFGSAAWFAALTVEMERVLEEKYWEERGDAVVAAMDLAEDEFMWTDADYDDADNDGNDRAEDGNTWTEDDEDTELFPIDY